jgi:GTPase
MIWRITIVWRPNVGKSSIFNLISWHKIAIVSDIENTTRDILEFQVNDKENSISYIIADSWWLTMGRDSDILKDTKKRVEESIKKSDIILFVLEFDKFTVLDEHILKILRKSKKEVILIWNKVDNESRMIDAYNLYSLWFKDVIFASSSHNKWTIEIKNKIAEKLKTLGLDYEESDYDETYIKLAIIGRPNVGKSSIVNAITWEDRVMVKDIPGTTRDAVDSIFEWNDNKFVIIDTAWIRRSGKIGCQNIEDWSVMRSERAISRADVVVIVIDSFEWITAGDQHIVQKAIEEYKWIILVMNKWDKVLAKPWVNKDTMMSEYIQYLKNKFEFLPYVTPIFTSAITGKRLEDILETSIKIKEERLKRVKTALFNEFLQQASYTHAPTWNKKSHNPKVYYWSQVDTNPPKFLISVNNPAHFHFSYKRYLENQIRENFWFWWTPIIIEYKWKENIFKNKKTTKTKKPSRHSKK